MPYGVKSSPPCFCVRYIMHIIALESRLRLGKSKAAHIMSCIEMPLTERGEIIFILIALLLRKPIRKYLELQFKGILSARWHNKSRINKVHYCAQIVPQYITGKTPRFLSIKVLVHSVYKCKMTSLPLTLLCLVSICYGHRTMD